MGFSFFRASEWLALSAILYPLGSLASPLDHYNVKRDATPNLSFDPNTTKSCTYWFDNLDASTTCEDIVKANRISREQFLRWNPALKMDGSVCTGVKLYVSYCVEAYLETVTPSIPAVTSTTRVSTTTSVSSRPSAASWTNLGCYIDAEQRTLLNKVDTEGGSEAITYEKCQAACWKNGYIYAGLEVGTECWCDNSIRNELAPDPKAGCDWACHGNTSQMCGSPWRVQVFRGNVALSPATSVTVPTTTRAPTVSATAPTGPVTWTLKGCYVDVIPPVVQRTLYQTMQVPGGATAMTIEACQNACWKANFPLAGVENARECYCGSSIRNSLSTDASTTCQSKCTGNANQLCGGSNRIHVYEGRIGNPDVETWTDLGCYVDPVNPRALDTLNTASPGGINNVTIDNCLSMSKTRSVKYAGLENANECWIGNTIKGQTTGLGECNKPCTGNKSQLCGGLSRLNIYEYALRTPTWVSMGCYTTSSSAQTLTYAAVTAAENNQLLVTNCQRVCLSRGFLYAGLTGGNACFCDNVLQSPGVPAPEGESGCYTSCTGTMTQNCGGTDRMSVFTLASL